MEESTGRPVPPGLEGEMDGERWRRWPCHQCGYDGRRFSLSCPECDALPWDREDAAGGTSPEHALVRPGTEIEVRSSGLLKTQFRLTTAAGFLGVLTRRFSGGADWLGADGREWRIDRLGLIGSVHLLRSGAGALAASEAPHPLREIFQVNHRVLCGARAWRFFRAGLARHDFLLAVEDGPDALRIQGTLIDPLRKIEILTEVPMPAVVLVAFLACGLRQGEGSA